MNGCLGTIHNSCSGGMAYSVCIQYEKEPPAISSLRGKCNNLEQVIGDIYSIIDKGMNTDKLGKSCLKYPKGKEVGNVLEVFEKEICNLKDKNSKGINNICEMSIEECGFDLTGLIDKCTGVKPKTLGELLNILISKHNE